MNKKNDDLKKVSPLELFTFPIKLLNEVSKNKNKEYLNDCNCRALKLK